MNQPGTLVIAVTLAACLLAGCGEESPQPREQVALIGDVEGTTAGPTVMNITFCSSKPEGYGNYKEQPGARYRAGQTAWIYLDVGNLESRTREDGRIENSLRQTIELRDPTGRLLMEEVVVDEVRLIGWGADPDAFFLQNFIAIPSGAPAGEYSVELLVEDRFSGAEVHAGGHFTVTP